MLLAKNLTFSKKKLNFFFILNKNISRCIVNGVLGHKYQVVLTYLLTNVSNVVLLRCSTFPDNSASLSCHETGLIFLACFSTGL